MVAVGGAHLKVTQRQWETVLHARSHTVDTRTMPIIPRTSSSIPTQPHIHTHAYTHILPQTLESPQCHLRCHPTVHVFP